MIFVTVGMHDQGFERLIRKMDEIAPELGEEVLIQIGHTRYEPKNAEWFRFLADDDDILKIYKKASLIVSHGGAGTLLSALSLAKPLVVVPRMKRFGEHIDDQQLELAEAMEEKECASIAYDVDEILEKIDSMRWKQEKKHDPDQNLIKFISDFLREVS